MMTDYYSNLKDTNKSQIQSMNTDEILQVSAYEELLKQLGKLFIWTAGIIMETDFQLGCHCGTWHVLSLVPSSGLRRHQVYG